MFKYPNNPSDQLILIFSKIISCCQSLKFPSLIQHISGFLTTILILDPLKISREELSTQQTLHIFPRFNWSFWQPCSGGHSSIPPCSCLIFEFYERQIDLSIFGNFHNVKKNSTFNIQSINSAMWAYPLKVEIFTILVIPMPLALKIPSPHDPLPTINLMILPTVSMRTIPELINHLSENLTSPIIAPPPPVDPSFSFQVRNVQTTSVASLAWVADKSGPTRGWRR